MCRKPRSPTSTTPSSAPSTPHRSGKPRRQPSEPLDGVRVFDAAGKALGHIHLPERCANLCFGGAKRNRLFMASSHSLYALFVNVQGAVP